MRRQDEITYDSPYEDRTSTSHTVQSTCSSIRSPSEADIVKCDGSVQWLPPWMMVVLLHEPKLTLQLEDLLYTVE
ncbi:hypothetical protein MRB53_039351 [Persea americana]|nr:hypothetical protein MRB53_039351 [Persea americana]